MSLLELFILAVGLSMDAFAVSVCKGLAMARCSLSSVMKIPTVSRASGTMASPWALRPPVDWRSPE